MKRKLIVLLTLVLIVGFGLMAQDYYANKSFKESEKGSRSTWARMKFKVIAGPTQRHKADWDWHAHPVGDLNMISHIRKNTSANLKMDWGIADLNKPKEVFSFPFIFMHAEMEPIFSQENLDTLREYLLRGGFLYIEDCVYKNGQEDTFFQSMMRHMQAILPEATIKKLDKDHEVFNCYYKFPQGMPYIQGVKGEHFGLFGVYYKGRIVAMLSPTDLHCAWVGAWFGKHTTKESYKMGLNLYVYAMTH
ncbi:MAG: hypothetical protein COA79_14475 [Planctomycetota bacterium]|nr:MAG: hypothetical protein COA79_14475 [Planctomycetota bacterium]